MGREKCLNELKFYAEDIKNKHPSALRMCDSWGEPFRLLGTTGQYIASLGFSN